MVGTKEDKRLGTKWVSRNTKICTTDPVLTATPFYIAKIRTPLRPSPLRLGLSNQIWLKRPVFNQI